MKLKHFTNIWDAIEPSMSCYTNTKAQHQLMIAIDKTVLDWNTTQAASVKRTRQTKPRLNDLLKSRVTKFSLDALINHATLAGLDMKVGKRAA